jgi:CMP-N-acetylneuraminic acid synthetase
MAHNKFIRNEKVLFKESESLLFEMDALRGVDIDNQNDLILAEALASHASFVEKLN